ncbi:MAG: phage tail assembly chaperone [Pseudorhodoplanes sp.]|nr:phage tail assembly chaperone [Pseudorhodoplanes sp.]
MAPEPFPWDRVIGFALGILRLPPTSFWSMTLRELALAIEVFGGRGAPLARTELETLMRAYPDGRRN